MQTHTNSRRRNRVYKSLHKPLTYLGVERTLFYFVCVGAVGVFNLFNSLVAGSIFFIGGYVFRPLGDEQRSGLPSHPCKVGTLQAALRRGQAERSARWRYFDAAHLIESSSRGETPIR